MGILLTLALIAGGAGTLSHLSASSTNKEAQEIVEHAQKRYEVAKEELEKARQNTESDLVSLVTTKKQILTTSMASFLQAYSHIKDVQLVLSTGLDEIQKFPLQEQDTIQLREMQNIYSSVVTSGIAGATAGSAMALAVSGSLPIVTSSLTAAGGAVMAGQFGLAASFAGSAISLGAALTPLSAIAAPVVLFTGISSSLKAEENKEKALAVAAEVDVAIEKMVVSEKFYHAVSKRAVMFQDLILKLNDVFSPCVDALNGVVKKRTGLFKGRPIKASLLTQEELALLCATRALAGAIKAAMDIPILDENGEIVSGSIKQSKEIGGQIPVLMTAAEEAKNNCLIEAKTSRNSIKYQEERRITSAKGKVGQVILAVIQWYLACSLAFSGFLLVFGGGVLAGAIWFASGILLCPLLFKTIKYRYHILMAIFLFVLGVFLV